MSVMEEFGNNDIGCTSLNVIIPATSYMTCIPTKKCRKQPPGPLLRGQRKELVSVLSSAHRGPEVVRMQGAPVASGVGDPSYFTLSEYMQMRAHNPLKGLANMFTFLDEVDRRTLNSAARCS